MHGYRVKNKIYVKIKKHQRSPDIIIQNNMFIGPKWANIHGFKLAKSTFMHNYIVIKY